MKIKCSCKHQYQDIAHGKSIRIHNKLAKKDKYPQEYRCTICGNVKTIS